MPADQAPLSCLDTRAGPFPFHVGFHIGPEIFDPPSLFAQIKKRISFAK